MKKRLTFIFKKILIYLGLLTLALLAGPALQTMAQEPWPGPVQLIPPTQLDQSSTFVGSRVEASVSSSGTSQLLGNSGFENGAWSPWEAYGGPTLDGNSKHGGSKSARLGNANNANDQIVQMVTVPAQASAITIDFWYRLATDETVTDADFFCYGLWNESGATALVQHCLDFGVAGNQDWGQETYSLTADEQAGVAGQTVLFAFIVLTDITQSSQVWVDDIALTVTLPTSQPPPQTQYKIFLPLTAKAPPPPPPDNEPPPGGGDSNAFWLPYIGGNDILTTYGTSVAVDSTGGVHVGYALYSGTDNGQQPAYYAYCPANCANIANWSLTRLSNFVREVRLALDPAGHPRMLLHVPLSEDAHEYQYASCDGGCANSANWTIISLLGTNENTGGRSKQNNRYFAIDPQGGPAFVYPDYADGHSGTFYAHCSFNCTNAGNWSEVMLFEGKWLGKPALTFTPAGQPRLAATYFSSDDIMWNLIYMSCDNACDNPGQWQTALVAPTIGGGTFSLQVDTNNRPRIAVYPTEAVLAEMQPGYLYYVWCNNTPCLSSNDWNKVSVGLPFMYGDWVDMKLDSANRPRLAYQMGDDGLGYAWCNANCESTSSWQTHTAESTEVIMAQYPPGLPQHQGCPYLTWLNGVRPSLALDPAGNPRLSYDAELWWGGSNPNIQCDIGVPVSRFTLFSQP